MLKPYDLKKTNALEETTSFCEDYRDLHSLHLHS